MKKIGLALGGGGAKGVAHASMLEVFDELGIRPCMISGTSIGSIFGALYASGMTAKQIRRGVNELTALPQNFKEFLKASYLPGWLDYIDIDISKSSLLKIDKFLIDLENIIGVTQFDELDIPLKVVTTDFWARKEVVFDSGEIVSAIAASSALPGLFKPVVHENRVLVDGGLVNPLPYDLLQADCDVVIAIDVIGHRSRRKDTLPTYTEAVFNSFQIAEKSILNEKFKQGLPDIYIDVGIKDVRVLDFHKTEEIFTQASVAKKQLKKQLVDLLD